MNRLDIRTANRDDLDFVIQCANAAYALYVPRIGRKPMPMVADFAAELARDHLEILQCEGEPVGYLVSFAQKDHLFIENVALHPDHQGGGLAGQLFAQLERRARSSNWPHLNSIPMKKCRKTLAYTHIWALKKPNAKPKMVFAGSICASGCDEGRK